MSAMMNRRSLFRGLPAFAAGLAVTPAIGAVIPGETPVAAAYRKWLRYDDAVINSPDDMDEDVFNALCDRKHQIERELCAIPSQTLRDVAMKIHAYTDRGRDFGSDGRGTDSQLLRELRDLAGLAA